MTGTNQQTQAPTRGRAYRRLRRGEVIHRAYLGRSQSGKTMLAKRDAFEAARDGRLVMVFDPIQDAPWPARWVTDDADAFVAAFWHKSNRGATWIIDEAATDFFGCGAESDRERARLLTRGRHALNAVWVVSQEYRGVSSALPPVARNQCYRIVCCTQGRRSCEALAEERVREEFLEAVTIPRGRYLYQASLNDAVERRAWDLAQYCARNPGFRRFVP